MATKTFIDHDPSAGLVNAEWLNEVDAIVHDIFAGAQTVAEAKIALALTLGTDAQAYDDTLQSISALGTVADRMIYTTNVDVWAETVLTAAARSILDDATTDDIRTTINAQPVDATLTSLAALGTVADRLAYTTALNTWAETLITSYGRSLIDDADAGTARTTLGLGTVAVESTVPIAKGGTGQTAAQAALDALSQVSGATNEHVLTKDTGTGNALWKVAVATLPAGTVLQVVSTAKTDVQSASMAAGASVAITGLSVNITPSSTASKILVIASVSLAAASAGGGILLNRDGSPVGVGDAASSRTPITSGAGAAQTNNTIGSSVINFLDSPNTTSSTAYSVDMFNMRTSTDTLYINQGTTDTDAAYSGRCISTITVMEIKE